MENTDCFSDIYFCESWRYSFLKKYWSFQPVRDVSERSQTDLHWERHLWDFLQASQRKWLFLTSLRRLKYISRKMPFCDVFKTSQKFLKKYVFSVTSKKHLSQVFVVFQKDPPYWFRVISVGLLQYLIK